MWSFSLEFIAASVAKICVTHGWKCACVILHILYSFLLEWNKKCKKKNDVHNICWTTLFFPLIHGRTYNTQGIPVRRKILFYIYCEYRMWIMFCMTVCPPATNVVLLIVINKAFIPGVKFWRKKESICETIGTQLLCKYRKGKCVSYSN